MAKKSTSEGPPPCKHLLDHVFEIQRASGDVVVATARIYGMVQEMLDMLEPIFRPEVLAARRKLFADAWADVKAKQDRLWKL